MKAFKKWWEDEKYKYPYRPINEIDCGMGWNAALKWALTQETDLQATELADAIRKELSS